MGFERAEQLERLRNPDGLMRRASFSLGTSAPRRLDHAPRLLRTVRRATPCSPRADEHARDTSRLRMAMARLSRPRGSRCRTARGGRDRRPARYRHCKTTLQDNESRLHDKTGAERPGRRENRRWTNPTMCSQRLDSNREMEPRGCPASARLAGNGSRCRPRRPARRRRFDARVGTCCVSRIKPPKAGTPTRARGRTRDSRPGPDVESPRDRCA